MKVKKKAFTLVEFLVVIGILAIVVSSILAFLTSTIRGSNQATVIGEVKQNGQLVLDSLEGKIRNAKSAAPFTQPTWSPKVAKGVQLNYADGSSLYIACFDQDLVGKKNGWIGLALVPFSNPPGVPTAASFQPLTNTDPIAGVDTGTGGTGLGQCDMEVYTSPINPTLAQVVYVSFRANQGISASSRVDFLANVDFKETITLRNY